MSQHHNLPEATPEFTPAPSGNEIRFPTCSDRHNTRARKEEDE